MTTPAPCPKVVFTDGSIRPEARARLAPTCNVVVLDAYPSEAAMIAACGDAQAILARLGTVTAGVIEAAPQLRIVARHGVGVDAVDLQVATAHGVVVTTTGQENAAAVAEYTFALLLALVRKVVAADAGMRRGDWARDPQVGMELDGRTLGIVGLGAIGRRVARQAIGFGMQVIACDPALAEAGMPGVELARFDDVIAEADILTLHTRLTARTQHMIGVRAISRMKRGALIVNTSRGEVIDEAALVAALDAGLLGGAALDTFEFEPLAADSPLRRRPDLLLSPHVAGQTEAALRRVALAAADAILDEFAGRRPQNVYNPEVYAVREARGRR